MTVTQLVLERFDDRGHYDGDPNSVRGQQQRAVDYAEGFAAGEAAAFAKAEELNNQLRVIIAAFEEKLTNFESAATVRLCESLVSAASKILPAVAEKYFSLEAALNLVETVTVTGDHALVIKTAPDNIEAVRKAFEPFEIAPDVTVESDPDLSKTQIRAEWRHGGIEFDTEKAIAVFIASLEKSIEQPNRE